MLFSRTPYMSLILLLIPALAKAQETTAVVVFPGTTQELEEVMIQQAQPDESLAYEAAVQDHKKRARLHIELLKLEKPPLPFIAWCTIFLQLMDELAHYNPELAAAIRPLRAEVEELKANAVSLGALEIGRRLGAHGASLKALGTYLGVSGGEPTSKEKMSLLKWIRTTLLK